jgi:hydrogenase/urease accessory protein HupE
LIRWLSLVVAALLAGWVTLAQAHEALPAVVTITEQSPDRFRLSLVLPPSLALSERPRLGLSGGCATISDPMERLNPSAGAVLDCAGGLEGKALLSRLPHGGPPVPLLVRVSWLTGETRTLLARTDSEPVELPLQASAGRAFRTYLVLGAEHILFGWDHLLFLLCLLLLSRQVRQLAIMATGFTIGHAVTITAASLHVAGLPQAPVEAAIALSIMILAAEVIRGNPRSLTARYPVTVAMAMGLLHGFGFATALLDIGLPPTELPAALLAFNLGVEAGQLAFLATCFAAGPVFAKASCWIKQIPSWARPALLRNGLAGAAGSVAGYWFVDRLPAVIGI